MPPPSAFYYGGVPGPARRILETGRFILLPGEKWEESEDGGCAVACFLGIVRWISLLSLCLEPRQQGNPLLTGLAHIRDSTRANPYLG